MIHLMQDLYVKRLSDAVAIKSVSAWTEGPYRDEIVKMVNEVKDVCKNWLCMCMHALISLPSSNIGRRDRENKLRSWSLAISLIEQEIDM